jgi:hypothetical protein
MGSSVPAWLLEDNYSRLDRIIHEVLPEEVDLTWAAELYERAGGDRSHPTFKKLWAAAGELHDATNAFVSHLEDMQHDIANRLPPED